MAEPSTTPTGSAPRRGRRWPARIGLVILGALAALLVAEAGLRIGRLSSPRLRALLYLPSARTQFDHFTSTEELLRASYFGFHPFGATRGFTLNSRGLRTREYAEEKPQGTFRAVVLGDSFTFDSSSVPYGWMWHQRAGSLLHRSSEQPVEVLSLSVPAVGPRFLLRLWELEGRRLDPDLVVFAFFVGNDFSDEAETALAPAAEHWSYTWRLLRNVTRLRTAAAASGTEPAGPEPRDDRTGGVEAVDYPERYDDDTPSLGAEQYLRIEERRLRLMAEGDGGRFQALCDDAVLVVERLARDVEARGADFVLLAIPDEAQVDADLRRRLLSATELATLDLQRPQRCLAAASERLDIHYLDLLPVFLRAGSQRLYRPRDTHWNAAGNRLAGRALAAFLRSRALGPAGG